MRVCARAGGCGLTGDAMLEGSHSQADAAASSAPAAHLAPLPLLATKLYAPVSPGPLVPRPDLIARLHASLRCRLTLIAAPAGFGKTTLLSAWLGAGMHWGHARPPVAWVSLEASDNDPARFWAYVLAALQRLRPDLGASAQAMLQIPPPHTPTIEAALTSLINDLAELADDTVLVLDDYHLITDTPIHAALAFLVEHLPPRLRLVLATRADPPLPLARWRARNQLAELRADDLRFSAAESAVFLSTTMGLQLKAPELALLERRTEGWPAGLQLAALSLRGRGDLSALLEAFSGSHRHVLRYLVEEVLDQQPPAIVDFLLQTSILDRFCAPLCNAVTAQNDSSALLERLEQANLFLVPLDAAGTWFRYHHLFAQVLRICLRRERPAAAPALHRRASAWFELHGLPAEAVRHALAANDQGRAGRLIEGYAGALLMRGEVTLLSSWIARLPEALVLQRPQLALAASWVFTLTGQPAAAARVLEQAAAAFAAPDLPHQLRAQLALMRSNLELVGGDPARLLRYAQEALALLPNDAPYAGALRAVAVRNTGVAALRRGDLALAEHMLAEAVELGAQSRNDFLALSALNLVGLLHFHRGCLSAALRAGERGLQMAGALGPLCCLAAIQVGEVLYEQNMLAEALPRLMQGVNLLSSQPLDGQTLIHGAVVLARTQYALGDTASAFATLREAEDWPGSPADTAAYLAAQRIRLELRQGRLTAALAWASGRALRNHPCPIAEPAAHEDCTLIRVRIAEGRAAHALQLVDQLLCTAEALGLTGNTIELLCLRALALVGAGRQPEALIALERALALAAPAGYIRTFADEGEPMRALILVLQARRQGEAAARRPAEHLKQILAAFAPPQHRITASLAEPLTEREIEILALIAEGYSNRSIADRLALAVSTVKWYVTHIHGKLGVSSRTQAIARARELQLI